MIPSYNKIWQLGHAKAPMHPSYKIVVQEKVDGSQVSFGLINGELQMRSKGAEIFVNSHEGMFAGFVNTCSNLAPMLIPEYVYRGEYLMKPKHNAIAYSRVPRMGIVLYDIMVAPEAYLLPSAVRIVADSIGLETVPTYYEGDPGVPMEALRHMLTKESFLGGSLVEGIVIKQYSQFTPDGQPSMWKLVRDEFKEVNKANWKKTNPNKGDIVEQIVAKYASPMRYAKALQHLVEEGKIVNANEDIGILMAEVGRDLTLEEQSAIMYDLWSYFGPKIVRGVVNGVPPWYKRKLSGEDSTP